MLPLRRPLCRVTRRRDHDARTMVHGERRRTPLASSCSPRARAGIPAGCRMFHLARERLPSRCEVRSNGSPDQPHVCEKRYPGSSFLLERSCFPSDVPSNVVDCGGALPIRSGAVAERLTCPSRRLACPSRWLACPSRRLACPPRGPACPPRRHPDRVLVCGSPRGPFHCAHRRVPSGPHCRSLSFAP